MTCRMLQIASLQDWLNSSKWLQGRSELNPAVEQDVLAIIANVRDNGDKALEEYNRKFDCPDFKLPFRISEQTIARAAASVSVDVRAQLEAAARNIRIFHEAQIERSWFTTRPDGTILGQRVLPIENIGLYVPAGKGGDTPLVSSLLMNAIPAQVAGCRRIAVATPPRKDGSINSNILAAAHLLDLNEIYAIGGAWSIAALALGTESIPRVDLIAGPGNIYVATAKRLLQGKVGVDMVAGPSEILIIADSGSNPAWIAADMIAQSEHDILASAICLVTDQKLGDSVHAELTRQLMKLPRSGIASRSLEDWGCIAVTASLQLAVNIANLIAPEHLELFVRDPWDALPFIVNAGAIFMGQNTPEPVGDYFAGPNHVLPTLGTARFSSGLSVGTFCKRTNIIAASAEFLKENSVEIAGLARLESLEGHARSVESRMSKYSGPFH